MDLKLFGAITFMSRFLVHRDKIGKLVFLSVPLFDKGSCIKRIIDRVIDSCLGCCRMCPVNLAAKRPVSPTLRSDTSVLSDNLWR